MIPIKNKEAFAVAGDDISTGSFLAGKTSAAASGQSKADVPIHCGTAPGDKLKLPFVVSAASDLQEEDEDFLDESMSTHSADLSNPWILAKLHASNRSRSQTTRVTTRSAAQKLLTPAKQRGDIVDGSPYSPGDRSSEHVPIEQPLPYPLRAWGPPQIDSPQNLTSDSIPSRTSFQASSMHPDLAETLDYEARKQKATDEYRARIRKEKALEAKQKRQFKKVAKQHTLDSMLVPSSGTGPPKDSPHKNRYNKAIASLHALESSLPSNDGQTSRGGKERSLRSTLPITTAPEPLDYVDEENWTSHLILPVSQSIETLSSLFTNAAQIDDYINQGCIINAFEAFDGEQEVDGLTESVERLVRRSYRRQGGGMAEGIEVNVVLPAISGEGHE